MKTTTNCEKCIFADYANSDEPCAMSIIAQIKNKKTIHISESNFNKILEYRCPFAFNIETYKQYQESIGDIEQLKIRLINNANIKYYLCVMISNEDECYDICQSIASLSVKPMFVSLVVRRNNNTKTIIDICTKMLGDISWKLHNILEDLDPQGVLDTVFDTNDIISKIDFLWINKSESSNSWNSDINKLNSIVAIEQPIIHALMRKNGDGLFLSFRNYYELMKYTKKNIYDSFKEIDNPQIYYYA